MCQVYFGSLDIRIFGVFKTSEDNLVWYYAHLSAASSGLPKQ